jgi:tetratricopeptide (TPR) repeat protein
LYDAGIYSAKSAYLCDGVMKTVEGQKDEAKQKEPQRLLGFSDGAIACVLIVISVFCYGNTLKNSFVYDDNRQVLENQYIKSWHYLPKIFSTTVWAFKGEIGTSNYYRPLMTFSYLLLWQAFPELPFGFHLFNVVLNMGVVLLVFYAGNALFRDRRIGLFSALIFAVHPVHTETVAWIAAVPDLEATFFCLVTFLLFAGRAPDGWRRQIPLIAGYFLALLSKEPSLLLAPLLVFYEHAVRTEDSEVSLPIKILRYAPVVSLGVFYLAVRAALFGSLVPVLQRATLSWPETFLSAFALVARYAKLLLWPANLSAFHVFYPSHSLGEAEVLAGIAIVALSAGIILLCWKRAPVISFSMLWIGFLLAPVLNARWMASNVLTERYLYLPSVGFCWIAAWCGTKFWENLPERRWIQLQVRGALLFATAVFVISCSAATIRRNRVWQSDEELYLQTLETDPDAYYIRSNLGVIYFDRGDYSAAEREWKRALAGKPDSVATLVDLALIQTREKRYPEAAELLQRAIRLKPLYADAHYNYGALLDKTGDSAKALQEYERAVEVAPLDAVAHRWYGKALVARGMREPAEQELQRSLALQPVYDTFQDLTRLYLNEGKNESAEATLRKFLAMFSSDAEGHFQLARILEAKGMKDEARAQYLAGLATDARNVEALKAVDRLR